MSASAAAGVGESIQFHELLLRWGPVYLEPFGSSMPVRQRQILTKILSCRTAARGGCLYWCPDCETHHYAYHSCNDRHCPRCGQEDAQAWLDHHSQLLLPTGYFLVTFTVPEPLRQWIRSHPSLGYRLLFETSSRALQDLAGNPNRLGATLGMLGVLHTWSRTLIYHPHIHYLIPGGGLSHDQRQWLSNGSRFLLAKWPVADHFRTLFAKALRREDPAALACIPARVWRQQWVMNLRAVGAGAPALKYLSRYVFQTATANPRLTLQSEGRWRWHYRNSTTRRWHHLDLEPLEIIRRFLQHILPQGFHRVRLFGWLHPGGRGKLNRVRALLGQAPCLTQAEQEAWKPIPDLAPVHELEEPLPPKPILCRRCRKPMILIGRWNPGELQPQPPQRAPP